MCKSLCMSTPDPAGVPEWDLADRLRKALRVSGVGALEMAEYLDISRNSVSNWINGHARPPGSAVKLWAMRTGVPYQWLRTGKVSNTPQPPGPATGRYSRNFGTTRNSDPTSIVTLAVTGSGRRVPVAA